MQMLKGHSKDLGGGLIVSRVLPGHPQQMVGPFIFFDQMGPMTAAPGQNVDVRPHPHVGLATVTWLFEGEMVHRDSLGVVQPIAPGDVNWMTSGNAFGEQSPAPTFSPMFYVAVVMEAGASLTLPAEHEERGVYLVQGDISVAELALNEKSLAFLPGGKPIEIKAGTKSRVMLLGGE